MNSHRPPRTAIVGFVVSVAMLLACLAWQALARPCLISNDAINYVDVARNIAAGRGITQSTLGYNSGRFPAEGDWPVPCRAQAPGFPIAVAGLILLGLDGARAATLTHVLGLAAAWVGVFLLVNELFGLAAGLAATAALLLVATMPGLAFHAWSESLAIALALFSTWAEVRHLVRRRVAGGAGPGGWLLPTAGALAGAAMATRYAFFVAGLIGAAALWDRRQPRASMRDMLRYGLAVLPFPLLVLAHSLWSGPAGILTAPPSTTSFAENLARVASVLSGARLAGAYAPAAWVVEALAVALLAFLLARRARRAGTPVGALFRGPRALLPTWAAGYATTTALLASWIFFEFGVRLLAPSLVFLALWGAALVVYALAASPRHVALAGTVLALVLAGRVAASPAAGLDPRPRGAAERDPG